MKFVKLFIKQLIAAILYYSGIVRRREAQLRGKGIILMYHRVVRDSDRRDDQLESQPGIVVSEQFFEKQLRYLASAYSVIPLESLLSSVVTGEGGERPVAAITFDDGWRDNHDVAAPLLAKYQSPATIFITTGFVDQSRMPWPELVMFSLRRAAGNEICGMVTGALAEAGINLGGSPGGRQRFSADEIENTIEALKGVHRDNRDRVVGKIIEATGAATGATAGERVMMNWAEVSQLKSRGVAIGGHGTSHELLDSLEKDALQTEIKECMNELRSRLGEQEYAFAYPNGNYNQSVKDAVRDAGFSCSVTTRRGIVDSSSDRYELPRINISDGCSSGCLGGFSKARFACHLLGVFSRS